MIAAPLPGTSSSPPLLALAPMAEITDSPFRCLAFEAGADACTTEMVSAAGLVRASRNTMPLLERLPEERGFLAVQLYGHDECELEEAAAIVAGMGRFQAVDLNAGCPMRRIVGNGDGAALMADLPLLGRCVAAISRGVARAFASSGHGAGASPLPVWVKTRIGLDPGRPAAAEIVRVCIENGASLVAVHGRYASRAHSGPVDAPRIAEAVAAAAEADVPVLANGGVRSAADAAALLRATGAAGVMVGRGAVGRDLSGIRLGLSPDFPALPSQTACHASACSAPEAQTSGSWPDLPSALAAFRRHLALLLKFKRQIARLWPDAAPLSPDAAVVIDARRSLFNYFKGFSGAAAFRKALQDARSYDDVLSFAEERFGRPLSPVGHVSISPRRRLPVAPSCSVDAPAKVNFTLDILGVRPDGYHELRSVVMPVSLFDSVEVTLRSDGLVTCETVGDGVDVSELSGLPLERQLAVKAVRALQRTLGRPDSLSGCDIRVRKRIPIGAGMGGGSADAAGVLACLRALWAPDMPQDDWLAAGAAVGSDVPALQLGGAVLMEGRGERVRRLLPQGCHPPPMWLVVAFPGFSVSTKAVYGAWDARPLDKAGGTWEDCARSVRDGDPGACAPTLSNGLQTVVSELHAQTERFCLALRRAGALRSLLSGSGSAVFGLAENEEAARRIAESLGGQIWSRVVSTLPDGVMAAHGPLVP